MHKRWGEALVPEPPSDNLQACVVLPARNEEDLLPSALQALAEQKTLDGAPLEHGLYEVILLINNSTDRTKYAAKSFQRLCPSLRLHIVERDFDESHAHIGYVRRRLMDEACRRLEYVGRPEGLVLSTDSDSRVMPNWICQNLRQIAQGAEVVGGRIVVLPSDRDSMPGVQEIYRYDYIYRRLICWLEDLCDPLPYDPWPRHHQHFGASLAITPRAYRAAGRLPPRRYLEDVAFYDALMRRDVRIRHSNSVRVFTSGRLNGRTRFGLSRQLKDWHGSRNQLLNVQVESGEFLKRLFTTRRQLRQLWIESRGQRQQSTWLADEASIALGISARRLLERTRAARYFGLLLYELHFYDCFRSKSPDASRRARLPNVVDQLQAAFKAARRAQVRSTEVCALRSS